MTRMNGFVVALVLAVVFGFIPASPAEAAGYWQQEPPILIGLDDKPCTQRQWEDQGWQRRVDDYGSGHVTYGAFHAQVQPYWSKVKSYWQAPPAVLQPGQRITFQFGNTFIAQSSWTEAFVWLYRMSGPGGGDDQLGSSGAAKASGAYTTKVHIVPEGFNGPAPEGTRLRYLMGATNACRVIFPYKWVPDGGGATAPRGITTEVNTDRYGSDYNCIRGVETPAACRTRCSEETQCKAYTWVKPGAIEPEAICCLKDAVPPATRNNNCVSGVK